LTDPASASGSVTSEESESSCLLEAVLARRAARSCVSAPRTAV